MKRTLSEFLGEAKKLRGSDFKFTFAGLQLTNMNVDQIDFGVQIDEYGHNSVCNEYMYMKNYHLIEPGALQFVEVVNYTHLLSHVTGEFPRCFSQKFTGIEMVWATAEVPDAGHLLWFLKSMKSVRTLALEKTGLSQEFYDQLPASARSLTSLDLKEGHWENELQLDFDFIRRLPGLSCLDIDPPPGPKSLSSLVRSLGRLEKSCVSVQLRGEPHFEIRKGRGLAELSIIKFNDLLFMSKNPDEIVSFVKEL